MPGRPLPDLAVGDELFYFYLFTFWTNFHRLAPFFLILVNGNSAGEFRFPQLQNHLSFSTGLGGKDGLPGITCAALWIIGAIGLDRREPAPTAPRRL